MKIAVSSLPKSQVSIRVEVVNDALTKYRERALQKLSNQVNMPGFRPGKVPANLLFERFGEEAISALTIDEALPSLYAEAVMEKKIFVVSRPEIKIVSNSPLIFEAVVAILPEVTLPDISGIKIEPKEVSVTDEDVDETVDAMVKRNAVYKIVEREAKTGDRLEIHFQGFDESGNKLEGTASRHHPVVIGDKAMVPGFEDQLIGLKKGENKIFEITFPADYHRKDFQNKKVKFEVEVVEVEERILPELNEELIEKLSGKKQSLEEFRTTLKEELLKYRQESEKQRHENEFLEKIMKNSVLELPEQIIEEEIDYLIEEMKRDLETRGISRKQFEEYLTEKQQDLRKDKRKEAEKRLTARIVLQKVFEKENISVSSEEITQEIEKVIATVPKEEKEAVGEIYTEGREPYLRLKNKLFLDKLFAKYQIKGV